ncbi:carbohydrate ABC transporter permease [Treponema primitia]|uniref:carbohydrate ABC transporter permease n=1 Tax=Treponema primitia TaxID=88058 RepID=UPI0002554EAF|nr:carbohydrate ABC transporter permease [Treponema primitia]
MKHKIKSGGDLAFNCISSVILFLALLVTFYPFMWMVLNSFRTTQEIFQHSFAMPSHFNFSVYRDAWKQANFSATFKNSVIVTVAIVAITILFGSMAAFAIARLRFPGRIVLHRLLSSSMIISGQLILIPLFFIIRNLKLYDNLLAVIFSSSAISMPFAIVFLHSFFRDIPTEIEESTVMDGCPKRVFFLRFILPLSKPALASLGIFQSLAAWNEYLYSLTFLKTESIRTIPLQMVNFFVMYRTEWQKLFAALTIAVVPLLILYGVSQKYFIRGLTAGAVKQ